ncbi:MAG: hypothetical protein R3C26_13590 [Calditrichia bacterium]
MIRKAPDCRCWQQLNAHPVTHNLVAIMAPHIDLRVGGACYTHAYKPLIEAETRQMYTLY